MELEVVFHADECRSSSRYTSASPFIVTVLERIASDLENTDTEQEPGFELKCVGLNGSLFSCFLLLSVSIRLMKVNK